MNAVARAIQGVGGPEFDDKMEGEDVKELLKQMKVGDGVLTNLAPRLQNICDCLHTLVVSKFRAGIVVVSAAEMVTALGLP